ncbi:MAG: hypothetical protein ACOCWG_02700 [bacterium]
MQRASLIISRYNSVEWRGTGEHILPSWYLVTWLVRIAKYSVLIAMVFVINWLWAIGLLLISFNLAVFLPIPYKALYKNIFRNKVKRISSIDKEEGSFYLEMLDNAGF